MSKVADGFFQPLMHQLLHDAPGELSLLEQCDTRFYGHLSRSLEKLEKQTFLVELSIRERPNRLRHERVKKSPRSFADHINHPFKESSNMKRQIFVNIAVTDLAKSRAFFSSLGFSFNEQFCDDTAACLVISEEIHAMLLTHDKMKGFLPKGHEIAGPKTHEALVCLSCESREEVDRLVDKAITEGGRTFSEPQDYGFMYYRSFQDLDGHIWEMAHMDMSKIPSEEPTKAGKA